MVWYVIGKSAKIWHQKEIYLSSGDNSSPAAKDPVPACVFVCVALFGNVLVININAMKGTKIVIMYHV